MVRLSPGQPSVLVNLKETTQFTTHVSKEKLSKLPNQIIERKTLPLLSLFAWPLWSGGLETEHGRE